MRDFHVALKHRSILRWSFESHVTIDPPIVLFVNQMNLVQICFTQIKKKNNPNCAKLPLLIPSCSQKNVWAEKQHHMYLTTLSNKRQVEVKDVIMGRVLAEVVDVSGLYLRATNLQGAGFVRSCTTFSVLVKQTDKKRILVNVVL